MQPYEAKKSVWVPCPKTGGYREGFLESGGDIANIGAEGADLTTKLVVVSEQKLSPILVDGHRVLQKWNRAIHKLKLCAYAEM